MRRSAVLICVFLAACGTPQEQCIRIESRELIVLDRLIAETRANLARGYALENVTRQELVWMRCDVPPGAPPRMCHEFVPVERQEPRAIDPTAERRKLAGLESKRREVETTLAPKIAACKARYP